MRQLLAALVTLLTMASAQAQDETMTPPEIPLLSVVLKPEEAIARGGHVQGQLVLQVRVISKFPFDELHLDMPEVTHAKVIRLVRPRTREVRSYAGDGFLFETAFAIFPSRSGTFTIPGVSVQGVVEPQVGVEERFDSKSPDLTFDIDGIDPSYRADWWLVANRIDMTETWSKPLDELRVGDTIRREVVVTAFGATAEQVPSIEHGRTQGIVVTDAGRSDATELSRDGVIATVSQAWDLRIDPVDVAYVSPVNLAYWNPLMQIEERATAPGYRIEPLPADRIALAAALLSEAEAQHDRNRFAMGLVLALVLLPFAVLGTALLWCVVPTRADRRLAQSCARASSPAGIYEACRQWEQESQLSKGVAQSCNRYRGLIRSAFSEQIDRIDTRQLVRELQGRSRMARLSALRARITNMLDLLVGPQSKLQFRGDQGS